MKRIAVMEFITEKVYQLFVSNKTGIFYRGVRHLIAGGIGTLVYIGIIALLVEIFNFHPVHATILSFTVLMLFIYGLNRAWVYNSTGGHSLTLPRYLTVVCISLLLNTGIMFFVVEILNGWYGLGILFAAAIVPITNFLLNYYWAFK